MSKPIVLAITGASGAVYAVRLLEMLARAERDIDLLMSSAAGDVFEQELDLTINPRNLNATSLFQSHRFRATRVADGDALAQRVRYHLSDDWMAPVASGSFLTSAMVICPCSGSTLSAIVSGAGNNLIHRAADVHLKERRKLVLVPRETPLSLVYLKNMQAACEAGAVVLPAMPGWYQGVETIDDIVDFVVARILDQLEIPHQLGRRWGEGRTE